MYAPFRFDRGEYSDRVIEYGAFIAKKYPYLNGIEGGWLPEEGSVGREDLDGIDSLMADKYMTEDRIMLTGHKRGSETSRVALNDIVIHRKDNLQILSLNVYVNGEFLNNYHADGIIVATPTGSTGYSMSAGGPIVDPKGDMILRTPNNAHNLTSKSSVLSGDDEIEIEILSRREQNDELACVSYDGDTTAELAVGDRFVISKAANHTKICKLHKRSFLEILRKKMGNYS